MRYFLQIIPWTVVIIVIYNILAFSNIQMDSLLIQRFDLPSGAELNITIGDALVAGGLIVLFVELLGATSTRATSVINHGLSMVVFVVCIMEFMLVRECGTTTFLLLMMMTLLDVVAGFSITIVSARRDLNAIHPHAPSG